MSDYYDAGLHHLINYMQDSSKASTTFQLRHDMMMHWDEVIAALYVAERTGGPEGYNLRATFSNFGPIYRRG